MTEDQPTQPSCSPTKFFIYQFLCVLGWLLTFGALAFVIVSGENILTVLQGWGMEEPFQVEV